MSGEGGGVARSRLGGRPRCRDQRQHRAARRRRPVTLTTADGLRLVGELALPLDRAPSATLVCLHPLPTARRHDGQPRAAQGRLAAPALAGIAVLRFNTRGTAQRARHQRGRVRRGRGGAARRAAAVELAECRRAAATLAPRLVLRHRPRAAPRAATRSSGRAPALAAAARSTDADLDRWAASGQPLVALVPELDDYLRPDEARERSRGSRRPRSSPSTGAKHLWVGEKYVRIALDEVVAARPAPASYHAARSSTPVRWSAGSDLSTNPLTGPGPGAAARVPLDKGMWDDVVGPLADAGWDVVAPDLRGVRRSPGTAPTGPTTSRRWRRWPRTCSPSSTARRAHRRARWVSMGG